MKSLHHASDRVERSQPEPHENTSPSPSSKRFSGGFYLTFLVMFTLMQFLEKPFFNILNPRQDELDKKQKRAFKYKGKKGLMSK